MRWSSGASMAEVPPSWRRFLPRFFDVAFTLEVILPQPASGSKVTLLGPFSTPKAFGNNSGVLQCIRLGEILVFAFAIGMHQPELARLLARHEIASLTKATSTLQLDHGQRRAR